MGGVALALLLSGAVVIRGALKGLSPVDSFRDIFDRATGGGGVTGWLPGIVAGQDPARHSETEFGPLPLPPGPSDRRPGADLITPI
jgi:hypothetical protein